MHLNLHENKINLKAQDRYLKNDVSESIVHVIKHANFQHYRKLFRKPSRSYLENLTIDDKVINKRVRLFIHHTMCREEKIISTSLQDIEIPEGTRRCSIRKFFKKFRKPHRKTPVLKPFLIKLQDLSLEFFSKGTPTQVLSCEVCETYL